MSNSAVTSTHLELASSPSYKAPANKTDTSGPTVNETSSTASYALSSSSEESPSLKHLQLSTLNRRKLQQSKHCSKTECTVILKQSRLLKKHITARKASRRHDTRSIAKKDNIIQTLRRRLADKKHGRQAKRYLDLNIQSRDEQTLAVHGQTSSKSFSYESSTEAQIPTTSPISQRTQPFNDNEIVEEVEDILGCLKSLSIVERSINAVTNSGNNIAMSTPMLVTAEPQPQTPFHRYPKNEDANIVSSEALAPAAVSSERGTITTESLRKDTITNESNLASKDLSAKPNTKYIYAVETAMGSEGSTVNSPATSSLFSSASSSTSLPSPSSNGSSDIDTSTMQKVLETAMAEESFLSTRFSFDVTTWREPKPAWMGPRYLQRLKLPEEDHEPVRFNQDTTILDEMAELTVLNGKQASWRTEDRGGVLQHFAPYAVDPASTEARDTDITDDETGESAPTAAQKQQQRFEVMSLKVEMVDAEAQWEEVSANDVEMTDADARDAKTGKPVQLQHQSPPRTTTIDTQMTDVDEEPVASSSAFQQQPPTTSSCGADIEMDDAQPLPVNPTVVQQQQQSATPQTTIMQRAQPMRQHQAKPSMRMKRAGASDLIERPRKARALNSPGEIEHVFSNPDPPKSAADSVTPKGDAVDKEDLTAVFEAFPDDD